VKVKDEHKRLRIIEKSMDLVYTQGIAGVKMAQLAKLVGISPSTLYVYFKSKEELLHSIYSELMNKDLDSSPITEEIDLPFKLKLKKMWLQWTNFAINNAKEMNFITQFKQSPYYEKLPEEVRDKNKQMVKDMFNDGIQEGLIKDLPFDILTAVMLGMMQQTVQLVLSKKMTLNQENADLMFSITWDAIKA